MQLVYVWKIHRHEAGMCYYGEQVVAYAEAGRVFGRWVADAKTSGWSSSLGPGGIMSFRSTAERTTNDEDDQDEDDSDSDGRCCYTCQVSASDNPFLCT